MKVLALALLASFSVSAMAECLGEAQVIGKIKNLIQTSQDYSFQISLKDSSSYFRANNLCPLTEQDVIEAVIKVQGTTSMKEGDVVSGVLSYNPETYAYELQ